MSKTYLFSLGHPAHFHLFKHTMRALSKKGNRIVVVVRPKDVLEQLCVNEGLPYVRVGEPSAGKGTVAKALEVVRRVRAIAKIVRPRFEPVAHGIEIGHSADSHVLGR